MSDKSDSQGKSGVLSQEHALLGATLEPAANGYLEASYYGDGSQEPEAFNQGAALCDVGSLVSTCISGKEAADFVSAVFTGPVPFAGQLVCSLALTGTGTVVSPALVAGIGPQDFCIWAPAETAEGLGSWLHGIAAIEQDGKAPFASVAFEPGAPFSTMLAMVGPQAPQVLEDYLAEGVKLPAPGTLGNISLDAIDTVMLHPKVPGASQKDPHNHAYLMVIPNQKVTVLWRSFLSFNSVTPVGTSAFWGWIQEKCPGIVDLLDEPTKPQTPQGLHLKDWLRPTDDFIGARALAKGQTP